MASPALNTFNTAIDAMSINAANKATAKNHGATLYASATQEAAAHLLAHLDAAIATATGEDLIRLQRLRLIVESVANDTNPALTDVPALIQSVTPAEFRWMKAVMYLLMSKTVQQASDRWDDLAAGGIPAGVQTRLRALRDLITTKLGA